MKGSAQTKLLSGTVRTPFGGVKVSKGLPANAAEVNKLFDQLDFQQATQAYLWTLPLVSFAEWQATHDEVFGATNHDIVLYANYADRLGILTANATTPYMMAFASIPTPHGPTRRRRASSRPAGRSGSVAPRAAWSIGSACIR